jgi:hypothetical protein
VIFCIDAPPGTAVQAGQEGNPAIGPCVITIKEVRKILALHWLWTSGMPPGINVECFRRDPYVFLSLLSNYYPKSSHQLGAIGQQPLLDVTLMFLNRSIVVEGAIAIITNLSMSKTFLFEDLNKCDLLVDAVYTGGSKGNAGDDPIDRVVGGGNQGGFRYLGSPRNNDLKLCVLYSNLGDPEWPDELIPANSTFVYYGDNKRPRCELLKTRRGGNLILRNVFADLHRSRRTFIPPFLIFTKGLKGRDAIFRGLAVPGAIGISQGKDLVAISKARAGQPFLNYRAIFTILNVPSISRTWLNELRCGTRQSENAPEPWVNWINDGVYTPLQAMSGTGTAS